MGMDSIRCSTVMTKSFIVEEDEDMGRRMESTRKARAVIDEKKFWGVPTRVISSSIWAVPH